MNLFGFISWTERPKDIQSRWLKKDPVGVVGLKSKFPELARARSPDEVRHLPWIFHPKPQYDIARIFSARPEQILAGHGLPFVRLILAGAGIGPTQLDQFSARERKLLAVAPFPPESPKVDIYLIYREQFGEQAESFVQKLGLAPRRRKINPNTQ